MQALALPPVVTREEWDRQTAPWKVLEVLDRAEGLAAWPAVLRQLLALYASPGCVVATFTTHLPALQRVSLVYTPDRFDSAAAATADGAPGDAIEEGEWGVGQRLPASAGHLFCAEDTYGKSTFYADASGDCLLTVCWAGADDSGDGAPSVSRYDLATGRTSVSRLDALWPAGTSQLPVVTPAPYSPAVALWNGAEGVCVQLRRCAPMVSVARPSLCFGVLLRCFWTRCGAFPAKAAEVPVAARLHSLWCVWPLKAVVAAWDGASEAWTVVGACHHQTYDPTWPVDAVVLRDGRHVAIFSSTRAGGGARQFAELYDAATGRSRPLDEWAPPCVWLPTQGIVCCDDWLLYFADGVEYTLLASPPLIAADESPALVAAEKPTGCTDEVADGCAGDGVARCPDKAVPPRPTTRWGARTNSLARFACTYATVPALAERTVLRGLLRTETAAQTPRSATPAEASI